MNRIVSEEFKIRGERFSTLDELISVTSQRQLNSVYNDDYGAKNGHEVKGYLEYSHEQSIEALRNGSDLFNDEWERTVRSSKIELDKCLDEIQRYKRKFDVVGGTVSVGRALAGQPDCFSHRVRKPQKVRTINLYYNLSCPWTYEAEERIKGGCTLMAVTEALEKSGYQVAITLLPTFSYRSISSDYAFVCEVPLKDYKTRLNVKKLQFALASKSVLFHLGKWWMHRSPEVTENLGYGEGSAVDNCDTWLNRAKGYVRKNGGFYLGCVPMRDKGYDIKKITEEIISQAEQVKR